MFGFCIGCGNRSPSSWAPLNYITINTSILHLISFPLLISSFQLSFSIAFIPAPILTESDFALGRRELFGESQIRTNSTKK